MSFEMIKDVLSIIGDSCIFAITVYTFYLKFWCKKIKFLQYAPSFNLFKGDSLTVTIENCSLSPICFTEVNIIYGNKYKLCISGNDESKIIEPYKIYVIKVKPFSYLDGINLFTLNSMQDIYLEISTTRGIVYSKFWKKTKIEKNKNLQEIMIYRKIFNKHLVFPDTRYAILFLENNEAQTVFVNDKGIMSESIGGFNGVPPECLEDAKQIAALFSEFFTSLRIPFRVERIEY